MVTEVDLHDGLGGFELDLKAIIEGALFAAGKPMSIKHLQTLFGEDAAPEVEVIEALLEEIAEDFRGRGVVLNKVASGYRFQVSQSVGQWVSRLWEEKPARYSRALLETLALVAYRQPVTRGEIEEVRGVSVSSHIMKTFLEREWVRVVGHKDVPGRPAMYATTRAFLDYFNLSNLDELPSLPDIQSLDPSALDPAANSAGADNEGENGSSEPEQLTLPLEPSEEGVAVQETVKEAAEKVVDETVEVGVTAEALTEKDIAEVDADETVMLHEPVSGEEDVKDVGVIDSMDSPEQVERSGSLESEKEEERIGAGISSLFDDKIGAVQDERKEFGSNLSDEDDSDREDSPKSADSFRNIEPTEDVLPDQESSLGIAD